MGAVVFRSIPPVLSVLILMVGKAVFQSQDWRRWKPRYFRIRSWPSRCTAFSANWFSATEYGRVCWVLRSWYAESLPVACPWFLNRLGLLGRAVALELLAGDFPGRQRGNTSSLCDKGRRSNTLAAQFISRVAASTFVSISEHSNRDRSENAWSYLFPPLMTSHRPNIRSHAFYAALRPDLPILVEW